MKDKTKDFGKKIRFKVQCIVHESNRGDLCLIGYTDKAVCFAPWEKRGEYHAMKSVSASIDDFEEVTDG